jgi:hypothetical protein
MTRAAESLGDRFVGFNIGGHGHACPLVAEFAEFTAPTAVGTD